MRACLRSLFACVLLAAPAAAQVGDAGEVVSLADSAAFAPAVEAAGSVEPVGYNAAAAGYGAGTVDYVARVRAGSGYFQDDFDSRMTGSYGLDLAAPIAGQWGAFGGVTYGHFAEGSQYFGSVGFYRQGVDCGGLADRLSGGVLFDQLVDTRFSGDLYVSQFRYFLGLAITDSVAAGVTYTDAVEGDTVIGTAAMGGGTTPLALESAEVIEAYVSAWMGANLVTATVGHRDDTSDAIAGLLVRRALSRTATGYFGVQSAGSRLWSGTFGLEMQFGPGACRGPRRHNAGGLLASTEAGGNRVLRAQSAGGPTNPFADASLGGNLSYGPEQMVTRLETPAVAGGLTVTTTGTLTETGGEDGGGEDLTPGIDTPVLVTGGGEEEPLNPLLRGIF